MTERNFAGTPDHDNCLNSSRLSNEVSKSTWNLSILLSPSVTNKKLKQQEVLNWCVEKCTITLFFGGHKKLGT